MRTTTAYQLGTYKFVVAIEPARSHNTQIVEYSTIEDTRLKEHIKYQARKFTIIENTQSIIDVQFLELMCQVPEMYVLKTERGDYNVVIDEFTIVQKYSYYEIRLALIEVSELKPYRVIVKTENTEFSDAITNVSVEPTSTERTGIVTFNLANKENEQTFLAKNGEIIELAAGENRELHNIGNYLIDKVYYQTNINGNTIRFEGRTSAASKLADTIYSIDVNWDTSTSVYDLITASSEYSILYNTGVAGTGVSTALQTRYLTSSRKISAGTTKLQALSDLMVFLKTDLAEEWVAYTSETQDILFVEPVKTGEDIDHVFNYGENIIDAITTETEGKRNWMLGLNGLIETFESTTFELISDDPYTYKHNAACIPTFNRAFVVASDTTNTRGIVISYDLTDGYRELLREESAQYNCCFPLGIGTILIGADTRIITYDITANPFSESNENLIKEKEYLTSKAQLINDGNTIVILESQQNVLYNDQIFVSQNAGDTWSFKNGPSGPSEEHVTTLFIAGDASNLWILGSYTVGATSYYGIWKSSNLGDSYVLDHTITITSNRIAWGLCARSGTAFVLYQEGTPISLKIDYTTGGSWSTVTLVTGITSLASATCTKNNTYYFVCYDTGTVKVTRSTSLTSWDTPVDLGKGSTCYQVQADGSLNELIVIICNGLQFQSKASDDNGGTFGNWVEFQTSNSGALYPAIFQGFATVWGRNVSAGIESFTLLYSLDKKVFSESFVHDYIQTDTSDEDYGWFLDFSYSDDDTLDIVYRRTIVSEGVNWYHRRYTLKEVQGIQDIPNVIAFAKLGIRYFALNATGSLYYSDTPTLEDSWTLIDDFGTTGYDLIVNFDTLFVAYDNKVDYATGTINESTTFTNHITDSTGDVISLNNHCNVTYAGTDDGTLYSFSDLAYTKTETNTEHAMGTNPIYAVESVMGDVFISYNTGELQRLYLTFTGDDTDWQSEYTFTGIVRELQIVDFQKLIALENNKFMVGTIQTPAGTDRLRAIARDLTDINTSGKLAEIFVTSDFTPQGLCSVTYFELLKRLVGISNYAIETFGSHVYNINDLASISIPGFSGTKEIRSIRITASLTTGFRTNLELGERFPDLARVIDNWVRGGTGFYETGGESGGISSHNLLNNLAWSVAGHTIDEPFNFNDNLLFDIKRYSQTTEPTLSVGELGFWYNPNRKTLFSIYQDATKGLVKDPLGPFEPIFDFILRSRFMLRPDLGSNVWTQATTGTGSITLRFPELDLITGATLDSIARIYSYGFTDVWSDNKDREAICSFSISARDDDVFNSSTTYLGFSDSSGEITDTTKFVGFKISAGNLFCHTADGTTSTNYDTTIDLLTKNVICTFSFLKTTTNEVLFFVDNVYQTTITTNLITNWFNERMVFQIKNDLAAITNSARIHSLVFTEMQ